MSSTLESEDLEHVQLVRMEDVQPSRERLPDHLYTTEVKEEDLETCIVDTLDYDNECVVDDDDSNIGSMVSIHSEEIIDEDIKEQEEDISEIVEDNDTDSFELIVPEALNPKKVIVNDLKPPKAKKQAPESWPTLEILPGGVINHIEKCEYESDTKEDEAEGEGDMYACAKCSRTFKHLFCLVKHVRGHEKQKKQEEPDLSKLSVCTRTTTSTRPSKIRVAMSQKEVPTKCAPVNGKFVCIHATKKPTIVSRVSKKRVPKKSKS